MPSWHAAVARRLLRTPRCRSSMQQFAKARKNPPAFLLNPDALVCGGIAISESVSIAGVSFFYLDDKPQGFVIHGAP